MFWVYKMIGINARYLEAQEYTKETIDGLLKKTSPNEVNIPYKDLILVRVFYQNRVGQTFKACKDKVDYPKDANFWLFGFGFIEELSWGILVNGCEKTSPLQALPPFLVTTQRGDTKSYQ